jgi:hypothetical protein
VAAERIQHAGNLQDRGAARKRGRGKGSPLATQALGLTLLPAPTLAVRSSMMFDFPT